MRIIRIVIGVVLFIYGLGLAKGIQITGFVPPGIDKSRVFYEYKRISHLLGSPYQSTIQPDLVVNFFTRRGSQAQSYGLPEWGGGGAIGSTAIVICVDNNPFLEHNLYQTMVHEIAHCVISKNCDSIWIPRWFHEGIAMLVSADANAYESMVLSKALFFGKLLSLGSIDSVNSFNQFQAEVAYCQSRQAVLFLVETYGIESVGQILGTVQKTRNFWVAIDSVFSLTETEFNRFSYDFMQKRINTMMWLADSSLLWIAASILVILIFFITLRQRYVRLKQMEAQEKMEAQQQASVQEFPPEILITPLDANDEQELRK